jgi:hypothetical protein
MRWGVSSVIISKAANGSPPPDESALAQRDVLYLGFHWYFLLTSPVPKLGAKKKKDLRTHRALSELRTINSKALATY